MKYIGIAIIVCLIANKLMAQDNSEDNAVIVAFFYSACLKSQSVIVNKATYKTSLADINFADIAKELYGKSDTTILRQMYKKAVYSPNSYEWNLNNTSCIQIKELKELRSNFTYYFVSLPVYDDSRLYAIIEFAVGTASNRMVGSHCLLKKENEKWNILAFFSNFAS